MTKKIYQIVKFTDQVNEKESICSQHDNNFDTLEQAIEEIGKYLNENDAFPCFVFSYENNNDNQLINKQLEYVEFKNHSLIREKLK